MSNSPVLAISIHPDDETLGCGGTLAKWKHECEIHWLIVSKIREDLNSRERIQSREQEIKEVAEHFGIKKVHQLSHPSQTLDSIQMGEMIKDIDAVIKEVKPQTLLIPNRSDVHSDHRFAFQAIYSCTKSFRNPFIKKILMYECLSETEFAPALPENAFIPNFFVDISGYIDDKLKGMRIYESEMMSPPYPRSESSIEAHARMRGSRIGVDYAECYMLLQDIV